MKSLWVVRPIGIIVAICAVLLITIFFVIIERPAHNQSMWPMERPPLYKVASAQSQAAEATSFLEEEAGISAYFTTSSPIDLDRIRDNYRTIELAEENFIIGSVEPPHYGENEDVHVFAHRDGWVVAYYPKSDPVAKIIDIWEYADSEGTRITTKLGNVLNTIAGELGIPNSAIGYYDFRYPEATHMTYVFESGNPGSFTIKLPATYGYYERGWSVGGYYPEMAINGTKVADVESRSWVAYGTLTNAQLMPNEAHTVEVDSYARDPVYGALVLVYRIP